MGRSKIPPDALTKGLDALVAGRCPVCDSPIRGEVVVDGNTRAMPCKHILRSEKP